MQAYFIGVDVGTRAARAAICDRQGRVLSVATQPIQLWEPEPEYFEQASEDIWKACVKCMRDVVAQSGVAAEEVRGIGFDATCSLVVVDASGNPVTVSKTGDPQRNVIVWMDHRAIEEADRINETNHDVLRYVGGKVSPEMEAPKLLWLKSHLPESWRRAGHFFDLADFLVYRATGSLTRSLCTTVCKWTYLAHEGDAQNGSGAGIAGWRNDFWSAIGLGELAEEGYRRIGEEMRPMGERAGGLAEAAAEELGLRPGTAVSVPVIDAHAGGIGVLGVSTEGKLQEHINERLVLICGTSSCHMAVSSDPRFIEGVWGPYYSAMIPGLWLTEGGQSATGALIDHVIFSHIRSVELRRESEVTGKTVYELLNEVLDRLATSVAFPALLTRDVHVLPYFHGNRSPRADPSLRGVVSGLRLSDSLEDLAVLYLATIQAIAHGTRHIIGEMNRSGYDVRTVIASGGLANNPVFLREHADITGCRVLIPEQQEAMLLGSAMLGAVAAGEYQSVMEAMEMMSGNSSLVEPAGGQVAGYHEAKHSVFQKLYDDFVSYRSLMTEAVPR